MTKANTAWQSPRQASPGRATERRTTTCRSETGARLPRPDSKASATDSPSGAGARVGKALVEAGCGGMPTAIGTRALAPVEAPGTPAGQPPRTADLRVSKTLWPPQPGTVRLLREHGDALVCVRYRHDTSGLYRYTTVELIVDHAFIGGSRFGHRLFEVTIDHGDRELRTMLMAEGSTWDPGRQTWCVSGATVRRLKLWPQVLRPLSK